MEKDEYKSPKIEIMNMEAEQAMLIASFTGEDIKDWEDM